MCLRESEGDHKLESQAITVVAYRQKTKTSKNECKMMTFIVQIYCVSFLLLIFI